MKFRIPFAAILATLALSLTAGATPPEVPAEVRGEPGAFIPIRAKTDGSEVVYVAVDIGLNVFPADLLADRKATVVTAVKPGRYKLLCYTAIGGKPTAPAYVVVVIGDVAPNPPQPVPPQPTPVPPGPKPPEPNVELVKKLRDALARDGGSKADVLKLAALWKLGAELALKKDEIPHSKELFRRMSEAGASLAGSLTAVRTAVALELTEQLGAPSETPLTDLRRQRFADVFIGIAAALDALAK